MASKPAVIRFLTGGTLVLDCAAAEGRVFDVDGAEYGVPPVVCAEDVVLKPVLPVYGLL